jgi:hypothetical protein
VSFNDGSSGTIIYSALGAPSQSKEFIEILGDHRSATLDDFRTLSLFGDSVRTRKNKAGDKGHSNQFQLLTEAIKTGGEAPILTSELIGSTLATLAIPMSLESGMPVDIDIDNIRLDSSNGQQNS